VARTRKSTDKRDKVANTGAHLGFEAKLWAAADALRNNNNIDAAEYKHVVLGLIFLKYISDAFEAKHAELEAQRSEGADVLGDRLTAYRKRIDNGEALRIVILVDRDGDDCTKLKAELERRAKDVGLPTKSQPDAGGRILVLNRIVIEELEAGFIGDPTALRAAFPKLPAISETSGIFRNPDNISGGTWEGLHRFLKKHGIYRSSYPKIDAAHRIAPHLDILRNRSKSFGHFVSGVEAILA
jgi:hypothetical protein